MIDVKDLHKAFKNQDISYFTGVPDSTLKEWISYLADNSTDLINRVAANEGTAIAHATGYYLATKKIGAVYMQNSGLGNCINPLTSLTDPQVYGIPILLLIGWRGRPGFHDEPQHVKMGAIMNEMLDLLDIPHSDLMPTHYTSTIEMAKKTAFKKHKPYALILKKGLFAPYEQKSAQVSEYSLSRELAITIIVSSINDDDIILSTTGKTSRELWEVSEKEKRGHKNNFYNVGSMGHLSSIGLEVALQKKDKKIYLLDGDGAFIMHMGSVATIGHYRPRNLTHILLDNASHESTGGQPTSSGNLDILSIFKGCHYESFVSIDSTEELKREFSLTKNCLSAIIIKIKQGSRADLGRPTDTPQKTKLRFMDWKNK